MSQAKHDYLAEMLSLQPESDAQAIIARRNQFAGVTPSYVSTLTGARTSVARKPDGKTDVGDAREKAQKQIQQIVHQFWELSDEDVESHLARLDIKTLPDLQSDIARLRHAKSFRSEIEWLDSKDGFQTEFAESIKQVLIVPRTVATHCRERTLRAVADGQFRKPQKMVSMVQKKCKGIYKHERKWFEQITKTANARVEYFEVFNLKINKDSVGMIVGIIIGILVALAKIWSDSK